MQSAFTPKASPVARMPELKLPDSDADTDLKPVWWEEGKQWVVPSDDPELPLGRACVGQHSRHPGRMLPWQQFSVVRSSTPHRLFPICKECDRIKGRNRHAAQQAERKLLRDNPPDNVIETPEEPTPEPTPQVAVVQVVAPVAVPTPRAVAKEIPMPDKMRVISRRLTELADWIEQGENRERILADRVKELEHELDKKRSDSTAFDELAAESASQLARRDAEIILREQRIAKLEEDLKTAQDDWDKDIKKFREFQENLKMIGFQIPDKYRI